MLRPNGEELHPPPLAGSHSAACAFPLHLPLLWSGVFQHHGFVAQRARRLGSSDASTAALQERLGAGLSLGSALGLEMNTDPEPSWLILL